ncbi:MAG: type II toxin-antitoxin system HicA family toxin [Acidobacteria bacterium]|nr:type II toxin-antitoxin system HicA family toxin [Acidobacteriota bacterium]
MKIPRDLSGHDLATALCRHWGNTQVHQVGSHTILQTQEPSPHRIVIPAHPALRVGTLNGILRAVARHKGVEKQDILDSINQ